MNNRNLHIVKWYSIIIGHVIIISWIFILFNSEIPEDKVEIIFHIISELLVAIACITGGMIIYRKKKIGAILSLTGLGMLIYSTLNAAGYYLNIGNYLVSILMMLIFIISICFSIVLMLFLIKTVS